MKTLVVFFSRFTPLKLASSAMLSTWLRSSLNWLASLARVALSGEATADCASALVGGRIAGVAAYEAVLAETKEIASASNSDGINGRQFDCFGCLLVGDIKV